MSDRHDLQRFVDAQATVIDQVLDELARGRKASHWMWFIFPQIRGLGFSLMAERFAIASLSEAQAYLDHPVLGPRLVDCVQLVNAVQHRSIEEILGSPDDLKFRSSMTLFARAASDAAVFRQALAKYHGGAEDPATLDRLSL